MAPKFGSPNSISNSSEIWIEIQISLLFCATLRLYIEAMCVHFFNFDHLGITLQSSDLIWGTTFCASSLLLPPLIFSSFKLLSMAYMVVSLCLTHLLLEVASPIIFPPSPFHCHSSSRRKGLHWWRRSKAYKLHMELHHVVLEHLRLGDVFLLPLSFCSVNSLYFLVLHIILHLYPPFSCVLVLFRVDSKR